MSAKHNSAPNSIFRNQGKDTKFVVEIPDKTDLSRERDNERRTFSPKLYQSLPHLLKEPLERLNDPIEKEVFLIGALGVISGILPNVRGFYDQQYYFPNLYIYLIAPYGSGKGGFKLARDLAKTIHQNRRDEAKKDLNRYKVENKEYKAGNKDEEPAPPKNYMLFLPANNSKSGITQLLNENEGKGILFETEGDTLSDTLKSDHGNFTDLLNKSFHHEPVTLFRRTGEEYQEIEKPQLSVVLSSTFDQYKKLIPTIQNGLFSRFIHYTLKPVAEFRNVFDKSKRSYPEYFAKCKFRSI